MGTFLRALFRQPLQVCGFGIVWGVPTFIFINDNIFEVTRIEGESMVPTLSPDYKTTGAMDGVLFNKWSPTSNLQRGDVVQFRNPYKPDGVAVKRVIALEGDTVLLDKKRRPTARAGPPPREAHAWDAWRGYATVPEGHVWVEGDNRLASKDSNTYGPISKSLIIGRAVAVTVPFSSRFWTKPWLGYESRTKVIPSTGGLGDWSKGLPIELAEVNSPHWTR